MSKSIFGKRTLAPLSSQHAALPQQRIPRWDSYCNSFVVPFLFVDAVDNVEHSSGFAGDECSD